MQLSTFLQYDYCGTRRGPISRNPAFNRHLGWGFLTMPTTYKQMPEGWRGNAGNALNILGYMASTDRQHRMSVIGRDLDIHHSSVNLALRTTTAIGLTTKKQIGTRGWLISITEGGRRQSLGTVEQLGELLNYGKRAQT